MRGGVLYFGRRPDMTQTLMKEERLTVEEFDQMGDDAHGYELVDGHLVEKPVSHLADWTSMQMVTRVNLYLWDNPIGMAFGPESSYRLGVPNSTRYARKPDVSVMLNEQLVDGSLPQGSYAGRPVLAFESVSPKDNATELFEKIGEYRAAGVPLIWVIYGIPRRGLIVEADGTMRLVNEDGGVFDGGDVLPGLRIKLADVLPPRPTPAAD